MTIDGKELKITLGSFAESMALQKAIGRALKGQRLDLGGLESDIIKKKEDGSIDLESVDLSGASGIATTLLNLVLGAACSDEVESCLFACAARCLFGQDKVNRDFFEEEKNRPYYYPIMIEIIKANCGPFIAGLGSSFGVLGQILAKSPMSK